MVKNPPANAGDVRDAGSIPGLGRSPGGGHDNPLQYSCLDNLVDRGVRGYSPWGHKGPDTTEATYRAQTLFTMGKLFVLVERIFWRCVKKTGHH